MRILVENYILLFFIGAVFGWLMEVTCKLIQFGRFINRGFLIGPYCPIYGFGAVLVTLLLSRYSDSPLAVFVMAMVVCGTLEYITSYLMEKLFHARWWDYSQRRFNLNGRVCANTLIPFGMLGLCMIYVVKPFLFGLFAKLSPLALHWISAVLCSVLLADTIVSATVLSKIRKTAEASGGDDTEAITASVREKLREQGALVRRAMRAFPYAKLYNGRLKEQWKQRRAEVNAEMKQRRAEMKLEIERREEKLRAEVKALKEQRKQGRNKAA